MIDCGFAQTFTQEMPNAVSYTADITSGTSATPAFAGTSSIVNGHLVVAVPPTTAAAGTMMTVQIDLTKAVPAGQNNFLILQTCKFYQLG